MKTAQGKRVFIRYKCRLEDGRVYLVGERNTLDFVVGTGRVPRALEDGLLGMEQGDHRVVRVPAAEAELFPFPNGSHFAFSTQTPRVGYDFGPGVGGDVSLSMPARQRERRQPLPAGAEVLFEVEMLAVQEEKGS